jgi:CheY-like chemotaxis protein
MARPADDPSRTAVLRGALADEQGTALAAEKKLIVNLTRGTALCAWHFTGHELRRTRGRLRELPPPRGCGSLLWDAPSFSAALMRGRIDAVFLDHDARVLAVAAPMRPWRVARGRRARAVLVLAAGEAERVAVRVGDQLGFHETHAAAGRGWDRGHEGSRRAAAGPGGAPPAAAPPIAPAPGRGGDAQHQRPRRRPPSVLVVSPDRRFRSVTSVLIARRGCAVATAENAGAVKDFTARIWPDVVVIDTDRRSRASTCEWVRAASHPRPLGVVLVDDDPVGVREPNGAQLIAKWGPVDRLYEAIEAADATRLRAGSGGGGA